MKKELENKIINNFPKLFYYYKNTKSRYPIIFGVDTGDGWFDLVYNLCKNIQEWCDKNDQAKQVKFTQIKEKWGELRVYCEGYPDEIDEMIAQAAKESITICQNCGSKNNIKITTGWVTYLCKDCYTEWEKRTLKME